MKTNNHKNIEETAASLAFLCERSRIAPERALRWTIIANTTAGGFTVKKRLRLHKKALEAAVEKAAMMPARGAEPSKTALSRQSAAKHGFCETKAAGDAALVTRELLREAAFEIERSPPDAKPFFLLISAGGDGTALEILREFFTAGENLKNDFAILRLPMGTGNDGADARNLGDALDILTGSVSVRHTSALRLTTSTPGKGPFYAFNILSAGLDAFVTHCTNRMKGHLPGDSYKLWLDIAALFYNRIYKVGLMEARAYDRDGNPVKQFRERTLLLAVGASGRRSYGAGNLILPDERNVCVMREMPLFRKIAIKKLVSRGGHINSREVSLFSASVIKFICEYPVLAQMDGETVLLEPADFPAVIEVSDPAIPVLAACGMENSRHERN
jgi:diacylglycerol kinase family enzyme